MMMNLTPKQLRFIDEYFLDFNATQAAIRAGYSPQTARIQASQNLTKLNIQSKIKDRFEFRRKTLDYDAYWIIEGLKEVHSRAFKENDYGAAIKALYLLGKHIGMFAPSFVSESTTNALEGVVINITQEAPPA